MHNEKINTRVKHIIDKLEKEKDLKNIRPPNEQLKMRSKKYESDNKLKVKSIRYSMK